ncbi:MAG: hypothetical protein LUE17_06675 [Planctomycetaceae bacterium]|nr:hypothetical protein [Planctomycetaceae bacterium]
MSDDIVLRVNGTEYSGWLAQRAARSIERVCGDFTLELTGRTKDYRPLDIHPMDECQILLGGEAVLTGYIDKRMPFYDAESFGLTIEGRDKTCDLVDCSADVDAFEFADADLETIANTLCAKFGIGLVIETDLDQPFEQFTIDPGMTAFACIEKAARQRGVLCTTNGLGDLVLCSRGSGRADDLIEGVNILSADGPQDFCDRFSVYKVNGQMPSFDAGFGEPSEDQFGQAFDQNIGRFRPLVINCECYADPGGARARAETECCCRAGKSTRSIVSVQGWRQSTGEIWMPNLLTTVRSPMIYLDGQTMVISSVCWTVDERGGPMSLLELNRLDAYLVSASGEVEWDPLDE